MNWRKLLIPVVVLLFCSGLIARDYMNNSKTQGGEAGFDYDAIAKTSVLDDGRIKPLDSVARNVLLALYGKQQIKHNGEKIDAIAWMMQVIAWPERAHDYKIFRVDHADLVELATSSDIDPKKKSAGGEGYGGDSEAYKVEKFISYAQMLPQRRQILEQAREYQEKEIPTVYEKAVVKLASQMSIYEAFFYSRRPLVIPPVPGAEGTDWEGYEIAMRVMNPEAAGSEALRYYGVIHMMRERSMSVEALLAQFQAQAEQGTGSNEMYFSASLYAGYMMGEAKWNGLVEQLLKNSETPELDRALYAQTREQLVSLSNDPSLWNVLEMTGNPLVEGVDAHWRDIITAYRAQDPAAFEEALAQREAALIKAGHDEVKTAGFELWLNRARPFYQSQVLLVLGFLLAMAVLYFGSTKKGSVGRQVWVAMMTVMVAAFVVQTLGIIARMYIHGRPPVTDLYSSAVLVGWVSVAFCLILEWITKRGIGGVVAAVCGFTTLIIAHHLHLESGKDTMGPMRAVLDSNFWLATHVVVVTMGYAATFVAGLLAIVYIGMGMATPRLDRPAARQLTSMVYGTVCFALLLSFVGTVLGGLWADQSWGRFWGWDPKENGAVMIVIMNAIILHAKWGKLVKERGFMVLAVSGNIITAWSWFGTNELGVGLHAYGFTEGTLKWLQRFVISQLLVMGVALLVPTQYWWSFRKPSKRPPPPAGGVSRASAAGTS